MPDTYILNEDGEPIAATMEEIGDSIGQRIAKTVIGDLKISTVFLAINHGWDPAGGGKPVLFETMVFHDGDTDDGERYTSLKDAVQGHQRYVSLYSEGYVNTQWGDIVLKIEGKNKVVPPTVWQRILDVELIEPEPIP